jgi:hypothetical protein
MPKSETSNMQVPPNKDGLISLTHYAYQALTESDIVIIRCLEDNIAIPATWKQYRQALRDIISDKSPGPLPTVPSYPGT